jgi:hypothetical protein
MTMLQSSGAGGKVPCHTQGGSGCRLAKLREVIGQFKIGWILSFTDSPLWGAAVTPRASALAFHDFCQVLFHQNAMTSRAGAIPH